MFDKDNKFGFISNNNDNSNNNIEGLDKVKADINNVKDEVNELNAQYKDIVNNKADKNDLQVQKSRIDNLATLKEGSTSGDAELIDGRVSSNGNVYSTIGDNIRNENNKIINFFNGVIFDKKYCYLFFTWEQGRYNSTDGTKMGNSDELYTKYIRFQNLIPCKNNEKITFKSNANDLYRYNIHIYDSNKQFMKSTGFVDTAVEFSVNVNSYFAITLGLKTYNPITPKDVTAPLEVWSEVKMSNVSYDDLTTDLQKTIKFTNNYSEIINFGDSIARGIGNRIDGKATSYAEIIANKYNATLTDCSIGGKCMSNKWNDGVLNQVETAITENSNKEFDLILIDGGTNDITNNIQLGEVGVTYNLADFDATTFSGSLESVFYNLKNKWPSSKIIFIIPHHMPCLDQSKQLQFHDKTIEVCEKWGIPVADIFKEGNMNTCIQKMAEYYCNYKSGEPFDRDTAHPNDKGYKGCYVPIIEKYL